MMHSPCIQHQDCILWDVFPLVGEVIRSGVGGAEPEGVVAALDL